MGPKLMQETNMEQLHSSGLAGLENISHPNNILQYRGGHTDVVMTLLEAGAQVRLFSYIVRQQGKAWHVLQPGYICIMVAGLL